MEQIKEHGKGRLQLITVEVILILITAFLFHYILNRETAENLPELKFPKSLALAILLRLNFYHTKTC